MLKSRRGCHSNKTVKNRTKLDRNENCGNSNFLPINNVLNQNTLVNFNRAVQSVNLVKNRKINSEEMEDGKMKKKTVRIEDCTDTGGERSINGSRNNRDYLPSNMSD